MTVVLNGGHSQCYGLVVGRSHECCPNSQPPQVGGAAGVKACSRLGGTGSFGLALLLHMSSCVFSVVHFNLFSCLWMSALFIRGETACPPPPHPQYLRIYIQMPLAGHLTPLDFSFY